MTISYGSQTGTLIESYAMDEALGDQSQQSGDRQVVVSDDIATAGNGEIGTKYPTYVGRKIIIDLDWTFKKDLSNETPSQERVLSLTYDSTNKKIVAGTYPDGQLWVSGDGGDTWTLKKDLGNETPAQTYVFALTYDPINDKIIAGTYPDGQLWVSGDGGDTWTLKKDLSNEGVDPQSRVYSLAYDSANDKIIAGTYPDAQIWVSGDGGDTWTLKKDLGNESPSQSYIMSLTYDSVNEKIVAGTGSIEGQLWVSGDGGDTWTLKKDLGNETPSQTYVYSLTYDLTNDKIIAGTYPDGQLWVSDDAGDTWVLKKDLGNETPSQSNVISLTYDSANGNIIAGTTGDAQIWVSWDGGETWALKKDLGNETPSQTNVYSLTYDSVNDKIIAGTDPDGQIWSFTNNKQERMVVSQAAGTGNTIILTVNEDWDTNPVAAINTIHAMYNVDDIETGGVSSGIDLSTRTGLYELTNFLVVGNATDPAGLLLHEATALESKDKGVLVAFTIKNNGRFDGGYREAGQSVSGGILTAYNNSDGEPWIEWQPGAKGKLLDTLLWSQLRVQLLQHAAGGDVTFRDSKVISGTYGSPWFDAKIYDCVIQGEGGSSEFQRVNAGTIIEGLILLATNGLHTADTDTTTETITIRDVVFIGNNVLITINSNKTWNVINPNWAVDPTDQGDLDFLTGTSNEVNEKYSIDAVVREADGTKIQNALVIVYENTQLDDLVQELLTDSLGVAAGSWVYKNFVDNAGTSLTVTTYGGHALRVDKWLFQPFVAAQPSDEKFDGSVTLIGDSNIVQTNQASAKSGGSGVTWNEQLPSSIIAFTGGSGTLSVGTLVTGGTSGASGLVTKIVDGNSVAGTVHLQIRNATDFFGTEGLSNGGGGWTATLTSGSQQDFTIWIDAVSITMQALYDYLAALTSETTLTATGELIHEWGRGEQGRALYLGTDGFYTERSYTKGVFITNFGAGTIEKFTDDAGGTWTPPTSVTLTITVEDEDGDPIENAQASIQKDAVDKADRTQYMNEDTTALGVASESFNYISDVDIVWKVRKSATADDPRYFARSGTGIITSSGFTQSVILKINEFV